MAIKSAHLTLCRHRVLHDAATQSLPVGLVPPRARPRHPAGPRGDAGQPSRTRSSVADPEVWSAPLRAAARRGKHECESAVASVRVSGKAVADLPRSRGLRQGRSGGARPSVS